MIKNKSISLKIISPPYRHKIYNNFFNLSILFIKNVIKFKKNIQGGNIMKFDKDTTIGEILEKAPDKAEILLEIGMHCLGCPASQMETLEEACDVHGIDVEEVITKLNA